MSDPSDLNPDFDPSAFAAEHYEDMLKVMVGHNATRIIDLFERPVHSHVAMALEPLPDMYGSEFRVRDDERHSKILEDQLGPLGVTGFSGEQPLPDTGRLRVYEAFLGSGVPTPSRYQYWLAERHFIDSKAGALLELLAFRHDPRHDPTFKGKLRALDESRESDNQAHWGRIMTKRLLEVPPDKPHS